MFAYSRYSVFSALLLFGCFVLFLGCIKPIVKESTKTGNQSVSDKVQFQTYESNATSISLSWNKSKLQVDTFQYYVVTIKGAVTGRYVEKSDTIRDIDKLDKVFSQLKEGESYGLRIASYDVRNKLRAQDEFSYSTKVISPDYKSEGTYTPPEGESVHCMSIDPDGNLIYIGTTKSILFSDTRFENEPTKITSVPSPPQHIVSANRFIVYTTTDSLYLFNLQSTKSFRVYLPGVTKIKITDDENIIYVANRDSIAAYNVRLDRHEKIAAIKFVGGEIMDFDFDDNFFYIATLGGLYSYEISIERIKLLLGGRGNKKYLAVHIADNGDLYVGRSVKENDAGNISVRNKEGDWSFFYQNAAGVSVKRIFSSGAVIYALLQDQAYIHLNNRWHLVPEKVNQSFRKTLFFTSYLNRSIYVLGRDQINAFSWTLR